MTLIQKTRIVLTCTFALLVIMACFFWIGYMDALIMSML